jgi:phage terminase large subunit
MSQIATARRINLYQRQTDFLIDSRRFLSFIGGVGSGKTFAGAGRAISAAAGNIGNTLIKAPNRGMITAPTYNVLRDATIPTFREFAGDLIAEMNYSPPINARLVNGSEIYFRSAHDMEHLRGPSISWWWGDEAALYARMVWPIMLGRLREYGKLGHAWLTTTPKGRNWIYQEFVEKSRPEYGVYKASTWMNPFIDLEYYLMLRDSYSGDFAKQELDGDFVAFSGLIFPEFDRLTHIKTTDPDRQWAQVIAGVDWGYANPGVILVYGVDGDGKMHGLHEEYQRRRMMNDWTTIASELQETFKIDAFYCDPAEPAFIEQFQQAGLNAQPAENAVTDGIQAVKVRLANERLTYDPSFVNLAAEMEQYQWAENALGVKDQPVKANDHAEDANRYAVMALENMSNWEAFTL